MTNEAKEKPDLVKKKLKHGTHFEPVARDKYMEILKFQESRPIRVRETGLVVNLFCFGLGAVLMVWYLMEVSHYLLDVWKSNAQKT